MHNSFGAFLTQVSIRDGEVRAAVQSVEQIRLSDPCLEVWSEIEVSAIHGFMVDKWVDFDI